MCTRGIQGEIPYGCVCFCVSVYKIGITEYYDQTDKKCDNSLETIMSSNIATIPLGSFRIIKGKALI